MPILTRKKSIKSEERTPTKKQKKKTQIQEELESPDSADDM